MNRARSYIFTTASTPADAAAALAALRVVRSPEGSELRDRLRANVERLRPGHPSPIVPVVCGSEARALAAADFLAARGLLRDRHPPADGAAGHLAPAGRAVGRAHARPGRRDSSTALAELFPDDA